MAAAGSPECAVGAGSSGRGNIILLLGERRLRDGTGADDTTSLLETLGWPRGSVGDFAGAEATEGSGSPHAER